MSKFRSCNDNHLHIIISVRYEDCMHTVHKVYLKDRLYINCNTYKGSISTDSGQDSADWIQDFANRGDVSTEQGQIRCLL